MHHKYSIPAGRGEHLLYLDFDGVLHHDAVLRSPKRGIYLDAPECFTLFQYVYLLERALRPYPAVRIVLSTSWVRVLSFSRAVKYLSPLLRARVIGATFHSCMDSDRFAGKPRGVQILDDVKRRQPASWLALDNDHVDWPAECLENLICTDDELGISQILVQKKIDTKFMTTFGAELDPPFLG